MKLPQNLCLNVLISGKHDTDFTLAAVDMKHKMPAKNSFTTESTETKTIPALYTC